MLIIIKGIRYIFICDETNAGEAFFTVGIQKLWLVLMLITAVTGVNSRRNAEAAFLSREQVQGRIWAQAPLARARQPTQVGVFCRVLANNNQCALH